MNKEREKLLRSVPYRPDHTLVKERAAVLPAISEHSSE